MAQPTLRNILYALSQHPRGDDLTFVNQHLDSYGMQLIPSSQLSPNRAYSGHEALIDNLFNLIEEGDRESAILLMTLVLNNDIEGVRNAFPSLSDDMLNESYTLA